MRFGLVFVVLLVCVVLASADTVNLRANQIGYRPADIKIGMAMTNEDLSNQSFRVVPVNGGQPVFSGSIGRDRGSYGNFSHVYEMVFSGLSAPGRYRLEVGANHSYPFTVGASIYTPLVPLTLKFFRVQRCGNTAPLLHGACHLKDGHTTDGRTMDASGGWHDAGDYLKFTVTIAGSLDFMLASYVRHPQLYPDTNGNGTPDGLEEARIGLDWLMKMWDSSRSMLYFQVGDESDHDVWRMPEGDDARYPVRKIWPCTKGRGANLAGKAAAAFALASIIWGDTSHPWADSKLSAAYLNAAKQVYVFGKARPASQSATSGFYDESSWKDDMALAGAELFRATKQQSYLSDAKKYATQMGIAFTFDLTTLHGFAHYEIASVDPSYRNTAAAKLNQELNAVADYGRSNAFGAGVKPFYWGCAEAMSGAAQEAFWYQELSGNTKFRGLAQTQIDFLLGANPWGVCWIGRAGTRFPRHPHHQIADITHNLLTGFWDEGPDELSDWKSQGIQLRGADPLAEFQSKEAVYHDDVEDYATNEPTIFTNALGLGLLSWLQPN